MNKMPEWSEYVTWVMRKKAEVEAFTAVEQTVSDHHKFVSDKSRRFHITQPFTVVWKKPVSDDEAHVIRAEMTTQGSRVFDLSVVSREIEDASTEEEVEEVVRRAFGERFWEAGHGGWLSIKDGYDFANMYGFTELPYKDGLADTYEWALARLATDQSWVN